MADANLISRCFVAGSAASRTRLIPAVGGPMRLIAIVTDSGSITRILAYLGEATQAPHIAPVRPRSALGQGLRTPPRH